jgi:polyhydroxyalkanoate synthesis regulator phasin
MDKILFSLAKNKEEIIQKKCNDVITDLILDDCLVKSNNDVMEQINKKTNNEENKIFDNIKKILDSDNYNENDENEQIEKIDILKNKIFSIVYHFLINKTDVSDFDEIVNQYHPNNPLQSIEIDNYIYKYIDHEKENQILLKLINIFKSNI